MKRLSIVVPYRNRPTHLKQFVPHIDAYFARDKLSSQIPYRVLIVEQDNELPFNRGALANIGFSLTQDESEYTCVHDVDWLPIWADYSWTENPAAIVWYGSETRPVAPGKSTWVTSHNLEEAFGAVVLISNGAFQKVNGFSNAYWGWGPEDADFRRRFLSAEIQLSRRKGTFRALDHDNAGFTLDGKSSAISIVNAKLYDEKWTDAGYYHSDGLSDLRYEILSRQPIRLMHPERDAKWEIVKVSLRSRPRRDQADAYVMPAIF